MLGGYFMMHDSLLPADTYVVFNKTIIGDIDHKILALLYQPILGSIAVSLYHTLWSYLDPTETSSNEWTHHHLMTCMRIKLHDIEEAREKLEAIGLMKTYQKKGNVNHYVYTLFSPLTPSEFMNNPILSTTLYRNIGDTAYKKTMEYFKIPTLNLRDYEEVTMSFKDVFESTDLSYVEQLEIETKTKKSASIEVESLDLESIFAMIPEDLFSKKSVTKETRNLLHKLGFIYQFNEEQMCELIRNSLNEKKTIDKNLLKTNCRKYYQFENNGKLPSLIFRNQPEYLRKPVGDQSKKAKMIYQFETTSPYDLLCSKYNGVRPSRSDLNLLEYLLLDMDLKPGVVNVLIDYVLKINQNKLTKGFVETIASQWAKSKVETVEGAMALAEKEYKSRKNNTKKNVETVKPDWFDKEIEAKEASLEKQKEMEEMLKAFK